MAQPRIYTRELLEEKVKISINYTDLCRKLGKFTMGSTYQLIKNRVLEYGIDTSHFLGMSSHSGIRHTGICKTKSPELVLVKNYKYRAKSKDLRRSLIMSGVKYHCNICAIKEWLGQSITLHVDHIDGDWSNCEKDNLRFLCPNCHSQTANYSGRNKPEKRKIFCDLCGSERSHGSINCKSCASTKRRIFNMSKEELSVLVWEKPTLVIAREFKVSDSVVAKRCKSLGISKPPKGYWQKKHGVGKHWKNIQNFN